jgi:hypothetical protein
MHLIHAVVPNSHILLFKLQTDTERGDEGFASLNYTTLLIQQMCEDHKATEVESKSPVRRNKQTRPLDVCLTDPERRTGQHFPNMYVAGQKTQAAICGAHAKGVTRRCQPDASNAMCHCALKLLRL